MFQVQFKTQLYVPDEYQCTGDVQVDLIRLCTLLDIKNIPPVYCQTTDTEGRAASSPTVSSFCVNITCYNTKTCGSYSGAAYICTKLIFFSNLAGAAHIQVRSIVPSLRYLSIHSLLYKNGVGSLTHLDFFVPLCVRVVYLDGNPLPRHSYHLLLSAESGISRLFLRNNRIGDEAARLIGSALSTAKTTNKNLLFLNLAFNCIGNAGAMYLAQGLRLNRALIYLSLADNRIGDSGAAALSEVLGEFPLTHEEAVERRKLLVEKSELVNVWPCVCLSHI
uniref:Uncharacterized protein n=1 Tax=Periophthalmus magnuspinnatus TaxID=409849 RepID=A0A3B4BFP2_9GOBI